MRGTIALVTLLLVPLAAGDPGHSGGAGSASQNVPFFVTLEGTNVTGGDILVPIDFPANLVAVTAFNRGTQPIIMELFLEEATHATWSVPADGRSHAFRAWLPTPGNVSMDFNSPTASAEAKQTIDVLVDWSGSCAYSPSSCISKLLAWEIPGANLVIPVTTGAAGTYEVHIPEPSAHLIEARVWSHDGAVAVSDARAGRGSGNLELSWTATADTTYSVWVTSLELVDDPRLNPGKNPALSTRISVVSEGPVKATPDLGALAVLCVLGLAAAARKRSAR